MNKPYKNLEYDVNKIIEYNPEIRKLVQSNPDLKSKLESTVTDIYNKYRGVVSAANYIDKIDRKTAAVKTGISFIPFVGKPLAKLLDLPELLAKGAYALYYTARTGDVKALPGWIACEGLSTILPFGQALDYTNIYKNRAQKMVRKKAEQQFMVYLKGGANPDYKPKYDPGKSLDMQPALRFA